MEPTGKNVDQRVLIVAS